MVGGSGFVRDRGTEFSERRPLSGDELRSELDAAVVEADQVLRAVDPNTLLDPTARTPEPSTYMRVIGLQVAHFAAHTGQIAYATKLIKGDAIDDIWRKAPSH